MSFFTSAWFWLAVIGIILVIVAIVLYTTRKPVEWWVWAILIAGVILAVLAVIIGVVQREKDYEFREKVRPVQPWEPQYSIMTGQPATTGYIV